MGALTGQAVGAADGGTDGLIHPVPVAGPAELITRAVGWRSGTAVSVDPVPTTPADPEIVQWSASYGPVDDRPPAGGAARDDRAARSAAIGELLERYAAANHPIPVVEPAAIPSGQRILTHQDFSLHDPEQQAAADFPYRDSYQRSELTRVYSLADNTPAWVPANLISNDPDLGHLATSNGLAAGPTTLSALLRAAQELIERDALMITWLHGIAARRIPTPAAVAELAAPVGAQVTVFDLTPAYSPHPVIAVAGAAPLAGRPRNAVGLACRATVEEALDKAVLEWAQGVSFAGVNTAGDRPEAAHTQPEEVIDFDRHAVFYTRRPDLWQQLPIWSGPMIEPRPTIAPQRLPEQLAELVGSLSSKGSELFYRDLTTVDLAGCGVRAVRVVSPALVPIHPDHRWPHLGGSCRDLGLRYPWVEPAADHDHFPSSYPHPLG